MKLIGIVLAIAVGLSQAQTGAGARMEFEVASIKLNKPGSPGRSINYDRASLTVAARVPANTPMQNLGAQIRPRLQTLLQDRFGLVVHRDTKILPAYGLVAVKTGLKLRKSMLAEESGAGKGLFTGHRGDLTAERITLRQIAELLSRELNNPVSDMTGIGRVFEIHLQWAPAESDALPGIFTAIQEHLGLKVEARKAPVEMLVIDHVEKMPSEN
jgi:uncharacterized protein (TIGR03435 family)